MISVSFQAIVAPPFNEGVLRLEMLNAARKISRQIKKDFERSTKTWSNKPKFVIDIGFGAEALQMGVFTNDENYARVSDGVEGKPRVARGLGGGKGAKALKIVPYTPKTVPGKLDAREGGEQEGPIIFRRYALEAGNIKERKFDTLVSEIWEEKLPEELQAAIDRAAVKTGYTF